MQVTALTPPRFQYGTWLRFEGSIKAHSMGMADERRETTVDMEASKLPVRATEVATEGPDMSVVGPQKS